MISRAASILMFMYLRSTLGVYTTISTKVKEGLYGPAHVKQKKENELNVAGEV